MNDRVKTSCVVWRWNDTETLMQREWKCLKGKDWEPLVLNVLDGDWTDGVMRSPRRRVSSVHHVDSKSLLSSAAWVGLIVLLAAGHEQENNTCHKSKDDFFHRVTPPIISCSRYFNLISPCVGPRLAREAWPGHERRTRRWLQSGQWWLLGCSWSSMLRNE